MLPIPGLGEDVIDIRKSTIVRRFVPKIVVKRFEERSDLSEKNKEEIKCITGVVAFFDISGFSRLANKLEMMEKGKRFRKKQLSARYSAAATYSSSGLGTGAEQLATKLNNTLTSIVDLILESGGDIIKFAGDALIVIWPATKVEIPPMVALACECALRCTEHTLEFNTSLHLHTGIGCGQILTGHAGGERDRWEFFIAGEANLQGVQAEAVSKRDQVVVSEVSRKMLQKLERLKAIELQSQPIPNTKFTEVTKIKLLRDKEWHQIKFPDYIDLHVASIIPIKENVLNLAKAYIPRPVMQMIESNSTSVNELRKVSVIFFSLLDTVEVPSSKCLLLEEEDDDDDDDGESDDHVNGNARNHSHPSSSSSTTTTSMENQKKLGRRELDDDDEDELERKKNGEHEPGREIQLEEDRREADKDLSDFLNQVQMRVKAVQEAAYSQFGTLRQFIVDDKGFVAIVVIGLPPHYFEDNAARAIKVAGALIHTGGIRAAAGICTGTVFCGAIGSTYRAEYSVTGECINLAARLMSRAQPNTALCDEATTNEVRTNHPWIKFDPVDHLELKGYDEPVSAYAPDLVALVNGANRGVQTHANSSSGVVHTLSRENIANGFGNGQTQQGEFSAIGQEELKEDICRAMFFDKERPCKAVFIEGDPGSGKTHIIHWAINVFSDSTRNLFYSIAEASESKTPFFVWRSILLEILKLNEEDVANRFHPQNHFPPGVDENYPEEYDGDNQLQAAGLNPSMSETMFPPPSDSHHHHHHQDSSAKSSPTHPSLTASNTITSSSKENVIQRTTSSSSKRHSIRGLFKNSLLPNDGPTSAQVSREDSLGDDEPAPAQPPSTRSRRPSALLGLTRSKTMVGMEKYTDRRRSSKSSLLSKRSKTFHEDEFFEALDQSSNAGPKSGPLPTVSPQHQQHDHGEDDGNDDSASSPNPPANKGPLAKISNVLTRSLSMGTGAVAGVTRPRKFSDKAIPTVLSTAIGMKSSSSSTTTTTNPGQQQQVHQEQQQQQQQQHHLVQQFSSGSPGNDFYIPSELDEEEIDLKEGSPSSVQSSPLQASSSAHGYFQSVDELSLSASCNNLESLAIGGSNAIGAPTWSNVAPPPHIVGGGRTKKPSFDNTGLSGRSSPILTAKKRLRSGSNASAYQNPHSLGGRFLQVSTHSGDQHIAEMSYVVQRLRASGKLKNRRLSSLAHVLPGFVFPSEHGASTTSLPTPSERTRVRTGSDMSAGESSVFNFFQNSKPTLFLKSLGSHNKSDLNSAGGIPPSPSSSSLIRRTNTVDQVFTFEVTTDDGGNITGSGAGESGTAQQSSQQHPPFLSYTSSSMTDLPVGYDHSRRYSSPTNAKEKVSHKEDIMDLMLSLLEEAGKIGPTVVIIDDAHNMDEDSCEMLRRAVMLGKATVEEKTTTFGKMNSASDLDILQQQASETDGPNVRFIITYRPFPNPESASKSWKQLMDLCVRERLSRGSSALSSMDEDDRGSHSTISRKPIRWEWCINTQLRPLTQRECASFLSIHRGIGIGSELIRFLFQQTKGNPGYLLNLFNGLMEQQLVRVDPLTGVAQVMEGLEKLPGENVLLLSLPGHFVADVYKRFDKINKNVQLILKLASAIGKLVPSNLLFYVYCKKMDQMGYETLKGTGNPSLKSSNSAEKLQQETKDTVFLDETINPFNSQSDESGEEGDAVHTGDSNVSSSSLQNFSSSGGGSSKYFQRNSLSGAWKKIGSKRPSSPNTKGSEEANSASGVLYVDTTILAAEFQQAIDELKSINFISEQAPKSIAPTGAVVPSFVFKEDSERCVIYNMMVNTDKQLIHQYILEWHEQENQSTMSGFDIGMLGYHAMLAEQYLKAFMFFELGIRDSFLNGDKESVECFAYSCKDIIESPRFMDEVEEFKNSRVRTVYAASLFRCKTFLMLAQYFIMMELWDDAKSYLTLTMQHSRYIVQALRQSSLTKRIYRFLLLKFDPTPRHPRYIHDNFFDLDEEVFLFESRKVVIKAKRLMDKLEQMNKVIQGYQRTLNVMIKQR